MAGQWTVNNEQWTIKSSQVPASSGKVLVSTGQSSAAPSWVSSSAANTFYQNMIKQLIGSTTDTGAILNILQAAQAKTITNINSTNDTSQKAFLQWFKTSIEIYLTTLQ